MLKPPCITSVTRARQVVLFPRSYLGRYSVNVYCLDSATIQSVSVVPFDCQYWEARRTNCVISPHHKPLEAMTTMTDHVYKLIELTGSSANSIEEAVNNAVNKAGKSVRNMRWFEVTNSRGHIENGQVAHWQVTIKVGFTLED